MMTDQRLAEVVSRDPRPDGRSTTTLRCPFCDTVTEARTWALAGSGKRCDCGAILSGRPSQYVATRYERG